MDNFMNKGFTLIELLISLFVAGIIMTGVFSAFKTQQDSYLSQEQVAEMQQNIRAGFYLMADELRMAGYDVDKNGNKTATAGITAASATGITFTLVADTDGVDNDNADGDNNSSTGADEAGELKAITYDLYDAYGDGVNDIGRQIGSVKAAVAENIEQIEFFFTLADGTQTTTPTATQLSDIRSVEISVLAITRQPDRKFNNSQTYTSASGVVWDLNGAAAGNGNPPNDNFRRRFQTTTVEFRNMGL